MREKDVDLVIRYGTEVAGGVLLRQRDVCEIEQHVKRDLSRLHRLIGTFVASDGAVAITTWRATAEQQKRLLAD